MNQERSFLHASAKGPVALLLALMLAASVVLATPVAADSNTEGPFSSEEQFITQQYRDFLGRDPDAGGLNFWVAKLKSGSGGDAVISALATSPEFEGRVAPVVRLYYAYFRRAPDIDGLKFWAGKLGQGLAPVNVSQAFTESSEFVNTYGSLNDQDFVELVYQNVLGRPSDAEGREFWLSQLAAGRSRGSVMLGFSDSVENIIALDPIVKATMLYVGMLGRTPDSGLDYWAGVLRDGGSYAGVIGGFIAQDEYRNRVQGLYTAKHPLTGQITESVNTGRALAVKVDNNQAAVPQRNLQYADIVYEEEVEYGISRFIAVYQSQFPATVGPVRSARPTDFGILQALNLPVLAASGGSQPVLAILSDNDGVSVLNRNRESTPGAYSRSTTRRAPHNLFVNPSQLMATAPTGTAPVAMFDYREAHQYSAAGFEHSLGVATNGVRVDFGGTKVDYQWDPALRGWKRDQAGQVHKMDDGTVIAPDNVVVLELPHEPFFANSDTPVATSTGTGVAHVYTDGKYIQGTWLRVDANQPFTLRVGPEPVLLTPGQTWVALARPGRVTQK